MIKASHKISIILCDDDDNSKCGLLKSFHSEIQLNEIAVYGVN